MSGLLRNILAFFAGLLAYASQPDGDRTVTHFWVTPLDTGLRVLKSDRYLQLVETAQVDYLLKTGKFFPVLRSGASFVNIAQFIRFARPVPVFSRVQVDTRLIYADEKCAYFSHAVSSRGSLAAEVLVKMKFKQGRITVPPSSFLAFQFGAMPARVLSWEQALAA